MDLLSNLSTVAANAVGCDERRISDGSAPPPFAKCAKGGHLGIYGKKEENWPSLIPNSVQKIS
jgi:hypothetical protein